MRLGRVFIEAGEFNLAIALCAQTVIASIKARERGLDPLQPRLRTPRHWRVVQMQAAGGKGGDIRFHENMLRRL